MSGTYTIEATTRINEHKSDVKTLRRDNKIPCIMYGKENKMVAVDRLSFEKVFAKAGEHSLISLMVDGAEHKVLIKDYAIDGVSRNVLHVDFMEITAGKKIRTHIPIRLNGTAQGVRLGGVLDHATHEAYVQCIPSEIPDSFEYDISGLDVGDTIHLKDLTFPEAVELIDDPEKVVCAVIGAAKMQAAEESAAAGGEVAEGEETDAETETEES